MATSLLKKQCHKYGLCGNAELKRRVSNTYVNLPQQTVVTAFLLSTDYI